MFKTILSLFYKGFCGVYVAARGKIPPAVIFDAFFARLGWARERPRDQRLRRVGDLRPASSSPVARKRANVPGSSPHPEGDT